MVFHRSLSENKSLQYSKTLLSILADLNNVVVWMISTSPQIFKYSNPFTKPLWIVPIEIAIMIMYRLLISPKNTRNRITEGKRLCSIHSKKVN